MTSRCGERRHLEALHYWRISREVRGIACGPTPPDTSIANAADELDVLAANTDWPALKQRCGSNLATVMSGMSAVCVA